MLRFGGWGELDDFAFSDAFALEGILAQQGLQLFAARGVCDRHAAGSRTSRPETMKMPRAYISS